MSVLTEIHGSDHPFRDITHPLTADVARPEEGKHEYGCAGRVDEKMDLSGSTKDALLDGKHAVEVQVQSLNSEASSPALLTAGTSMGEDTARSILNSVLSDDYVQKIWKIAGKVINRHDPPDLYPHYTLPGLSYYVYHDSTFWTSGFFPGSVWALYERSLKMDLSLSSAHLLEAARKWQVEMAKEQFKTDNHDLGFMIMPSFARDHMLTGSESSLQVVLNAAASLASRFSPVTGVIRSWAGARTKVYDLNQPDVDFVVVIDSMMNLDLLYYASQHTGDPRYAEIATTHALTTLKHHVRPNFSTYHLVNYDARDGSVRDQLTCQGYADDSTWARGQAWALYGYATAYRFSRREEFLDAAIKLADYFLSRVGKGEVDSDAGVVYWDFDAPRPGVWDVSAAMCACSGMLLLRELAPQRCGGYLEQVLVILETAMRRAEGKGDALFDRSTVNDNPNAFHRMSEHGLVYADYYFLETGNRLLDILEREKEKKREVQGKNGTVNGVNAAL